LFTRRCRRRGSIRAIDATECNSYLKEKEMSNLVKQFIRDDSGASALEYGLVVGLIALVIIAGLGLAGGTLSNLFNYIGHELSNVTPAA
jgi:pilus assembly protein Flp/PilA